MSIISFRCHTTIHLAPLVNQETIHQDMDRGQQLMSRINQGILREIKPKNPLVEWYYWKDKHTVSDVTEQSLFKMAQGMLSPVENDNYRLEEIEELNNAWAVYDKKLNTFFAFDPAITTLQKDEKRNRVLVVCEDKERGLIDVIEAGALLLECLRAFTGIEELCFLPLNPDYYIWTGMVTGIDGLKMRSNGYAGTWLLLQSESQVKKLRMLATIYSMDYPDLVDSDELARRLAKEEAAGQCIRSRHGIVLFTEEGLVYMDGTNPDNDWELKYPIYENDCYYEMLRFAYRKQVSGELENYCAWKAWLNKDFT